jgi:hypothetical protein
MVPLVPDLLFTDVTVMRIDHDVEGNDMELHLRMSFGTFLQEPL